MVYLDTIQAGEYLGYSVKTISRFCREGRLKHARVGKRGDYRFRSEWLDMFMDSQSRTPLLNQRKDTKPVAPSITSNQLATALAKRSKSIRPTVTS